MSIYHSAKPKMRMMWS